jgi:AP-2 complex subunit sigma-1
MLPLSQAIQFLLIQNRQGKTRLSKWYIPYCDTDKQEIKEEVHKLTSSRDQRNQANIVEFRKSGDILLHRRYAGLFFCCCVTPDCNPLAYLEAMHLFVEILDGFFSNVCELDLVFNFYKVYAILDEVFLAGELEELSKSAILSRLQYLVRQDLLF